MNYSISTIAGTIAVSGLTLALNITPALARHAPAAHRQGNVTYVTGSAGESDAIEHRARYYPLELEFLRTAKPEDEHVSGVKVRIKDAHDKMVLNVTADGPFLLARMPAGKYTVSAERNGKFEYRQIKLAAREHQRVVFEWQS